MFIHITLKICILLVYLIVIVILFRLLDTIAWYETGLLATQLVDPLSLSVFKLKSLLDTRGLGYDGVVEKEELVKLVQNSGQIINGEVSLLEKTTDSEDDKAATEFTSGAHFLEEVEDKKDSVWLIQVIPAAEVPLLKKKVWNSVMKKVTKFGIQTGVFTCARDIRFCHRKGWSSPLLLLAMPEGHYQKDEVVMKKLFTSKTSLSVLQWINEELSSKIFEIQNHKVLCEQWVNNQENENPSVKVILFSSRKDLSFFYSVVSLKYSGRIKFGVYSDHQSDRSCSQLEIDKKHQILIVTPERVWVYGSNPGEYHNVKSFDLLLRSLSPEVNDLFILSFTIVNIFCLMDLFVVSGGVAKVLIGFVWHLIKYNFYFILLWLPLQWLFQVSLLGPFSSFSWRMVRSFCQSSFAAQLRQDCLHHSNHHLWFIGLFCALCFIAGQIYKRFRPVVQEDNLTSLEWIRLIWHQYYLFLLRPNNNYSSPSMTVNQLEEGIDVLFNHLPTPDLWLHPVISGEYIVNLDQWKYGGLPEKEEADDGCLERLCSSCRSNWVRFNCFNDREAKGEQFQKACADVRELFEEDKSTTEQPKSLENLGYDKSVLTECQPNHENEIDTYSGTITCENCGGSRNGCSLSTHESVPHSVQLNSSQKCLDDHCSKNFPAPLGIKEDLISSSEVISDTCKSSERSSRSTWKRPKVVIPDGCDPWPESMIECADCAICLELYQLGSSLCGLPCGHVYHHQCVKEWLTNGNHICPTCRWPAFKRKAAKLSRYKE